MCFGPVRCGRNVVARVFLVLTKRVVLRRFGGAYGLLLVAGLCGTASAQNSKVLPDISFVTTTALAVSPALAGYREPVTLKATVSSGGGTINGDTVSFYYATTTLLGTVAVSSNVAQLITTGLPVSANSVTAHFSGGAINGIGYVSSVSSAKTVTVSVQSVFLGGSGSVGSLYADGTQQSAATTGGGSGTAVDDNGNVWSINGSGTGLSVFTDVGAVSTTHSPTGMVGGSALAIDGGSNVWVGNSNGTVSEVLNAGTTFATILGSTTAAPGGIAIDLSGNVWVANPAFNSVDEIIGGATPAAPLVAAVVTSTPGNKP